MGRPNLGKRDLVKLVRTDFQTRRAAAASALADLTIKLADIGLRPSQRLIEELAIDCGIIIRVKGRFHGFVTPEASTTDITLNDDIARRLDPEEQRALSLLLSKIGPLENK